MKEGSRKPKRHGRLAAGLSLIAGLPLSLLLLLILLRGTLYLNLFMLAWVTGLSSGFLMIALRPTESLEFYYRNYWYARARIVLTCVSVVILVVTLGIYASSQLLPVLDLLLLLLAIVVAVANGAAVYFLGKRSI